MPRRYRAPGVGPTFVRSALAFASLILAAQAADLPVKVDGPPVTVAPGKAGQPVRFTFEAQAGQRLGFGVSALEFTPASAAGIGLTVKQPGGLAVRGMEWLHCVATGPDGACDGEFTVAAGGTHVIEVDAPFSSSPRFSIQLSSAVARALAIGRSESVTLSRPGQDGWLGLAVAAGQDVAVALRDVVPGDKAARFALRIRRPDGSLAGEAAADARLGASVSLGSAPTAGTYRVEVDPDRGATGTFVVAAKVAARAAEGSVDIASGTNEELRFDFDVSDGESVSVGLDNIRHTPDVDSNSRLLVLGPDGTRIGGLGCRTVARGAPVPCIVRTAGLKAGKHILVVAPPPGASIAATLFRTQDVTAKLDPGSPNRIELRQPGQAARYTFTGQAGERVGFSVSRIAPDDGSLVTVRLLGPSGLPVTGRGIPPGKASVEVPAIALPATGNYTLLVEAGFKTVAVSVSLVR